ncbi:MAG: S8 family serine peptidase [candidate division WOR-3 bacterium]|jgi:serine protease
MIFLILSQIIPDEYIIRFKDSASKEKFIRNYRQIVKKEVYGLNAVVIKTKDISQIQKTSDILYIQNAINYKIFFNPNDSLYKYQYNAYITYLDKAWDITQGSLSVGIAVVDQGVDYQHPDLALQFDPVNKGYDFVNNDNDPLPNKNITTEIHGTHVAGIISATMNNLIGIAGVGNFRLYSYRVCDTIGNCPDYNVASGIIMASKNPNVRVINLSLGSPIGSNTIKEAIDSAIKYNKIVVAAAGNDGSFVNYPAAYDSVIAVGAWDTTSQKANFSSWGKELDIMAPGVWILSTINSNLQANNSCGMNEVFIGYGCLTGTSMATPFISGVIGLILSIKPNLNFNQIRDILCTSAEDVGDPGFDEKTGCGLVNVYKALIKAQQFQ